MVKSHNDQLSAVGSTPASEPASSATVPISTRVEDRPRRVHKRRTAAEKARIALAYKACQAPSERGALLRQEGIYADQAIDWLKAYETGGIAALDWPKKRSHQVTPTKSSSATGTTQSPDTATETEQQELARLRRELARQTARAEQAEAVVAIQKKVLQLWELAENQSGKKS